MSIEFAQKAIILAGRTILMVRKSSVDPHNPCCWELPGGRMKSGEGLDEHLRREVWEEVGLEVCPAEPVAMWSWQMEDETGIATTVVAVARMCADVTGEVTGAHRDVDDFLDEVEWVPISQVLDRDIIPSQKEVLESLVLGLARR